MILCKAHLRKNKTLIPNLDHYRFSNNKKICFLFVIDLFILLKPLCVYDYVEKHSRWETLSNNFLISAKPSARIYRPAFSWNKPKMLVFSHWKRAFWACFRENLVYIGHRNVSVFLSEKILKVKSLTIFVKHPQKYTHNKFYMGKLKGLYQRMLCTSSLLAKGCCPTKTVRQ